MARTRRLAVAVLVTLGTVIASGATAAEAASGVALDRHAPQAVTFAPARVAPGDPGVFVAPKTTLKLGSKGAVVKQLQARLKELGYLPGKIDGRYGGATLTAVWAFRKAQGLPASSKIGTTVWRALENPKPPRVLVPNGKPYRVEVNLTTQLMVLYRNNRPTLISHISSGSGIPYVEWAQWNGKRQRFSGDARTPTGDYKTTWRRSGWHRSYLGQLYNPIFFNGGIALHGAYSVPLYPASHGCVRLPMHVAEVLPDLLGTGVPVHVRGKFRR
ncbi:L,D-transpeptidase family protein [Thermopolyspora sp. NPDC052614]|uniref:L,D-transpeptidase family protein n=1 Tax=Thermopolyspora sp. NPDC052614 TaxID=3155682 RepID=UPI0034197192